MANKGVRAATLSNRAEEEAFNSMHRGSHMGACKKIVEGALNGDHPRNIRLKELAMLKKMALELDRPGMVMANEAAVNNLTSGPTSKLSHTEYNVHATRDQIADLYDQGVL